MMIPRAWLAGYWSFFRPSSTGLGMKSMARPPPSIIRTGIAVTTHPAQYIAFGVGVEAAWASVSIGSPVEMFRLNIGSNNTEPGHQIRRVRCADLFDQAHAQRSAQRTLR